MSVINTTLGRRFTETVSTPSLDAKGKAIPGAYDRVPAIWEGCTQPLESRQYYPGDPMSDAGVKIVQAQVRATHDRELLKMSTARRTR